MMWKRPAAPLKGPAGMHALIARRVLEVVDAHWSSLFHVQSWHELESLKLVEPGELAAILGRDASPAEERLIGDYIQRRVSWMSQKGEVL